jgi:hypothetical protein
VMTWTPPVTGAFDHYDVHQGDLAPLELGEYSHQPADLGCAVRPPSLRLGLDRTGPADYFLVVAACAVPGASDVSGPFGRDSAGWTRPTNRELGLTECP